MGQQVADQASSSQVSAVETAQRPGWRRRNYLINRRYQLRASLLGGLSVMLLLVFINLVWYVLSAQTAASILFEAPELARQVASQQRTFYYLLLAASSVVIVGVIVITVLETHRTAGAAYNLQKRMQEIETGHSNARVTLRRDDNLQELGDAFNSMSKALDERVRRQADKLEDLAAQAERVSEPGAARALASRLARMADRVREGAA